MRLTADLLREATGCTPARAEQFAQHLRAACEWYHIVTPARLAAFLAQIGHESGSLRWVREIHDGSNYEGRADLGNTQPGDGQRYRGRGLLQVTGRANYRDTARQLAWAHPPDFEQDPEALEQPRWAAYSAANWWQAHGCNALADAGKFVAIGRLINRGNANATQPAFGEADRLARWETAKAAVAQAVYVAEADSAQQAAPAGGQAATPAGGSTPAAPPNPPKPLESSPIPAGEAADWPPASEQTMPPFLIPAIVELAKSLPKLGSMFASSEVAQRNVKAAEVVLNAVVPAVQAANAQEAVERIAADPAARATAEKAVQEVWWQISEAGGGGIEGARKADAAAMSGDGPWWQFLRSPSFWAMLLLVPLVYLLVGSLIGLWGTAQWSDDVRAGLAGSIISAVIGGAVGYYWGQTTSRNRTPA